MKSRLTSFYGKERVTNRYYNEYLQIIFDPKVHRIIEECIEKYQWNWAWGFTDEFVSAFPAIDIEKLGYNDRGYPLNINDLRKQALWYAKESKLDQKIRKAEKKICYHCKKKFLESSLPFIFIHPLTVSNIDFCYYCLSDASVGKTNHTEKSISKFANDIASFIGRPPSQTKYVSLKALLIDYDYYSYSHGDRLVLLNILCERPDKDIVKTLYGSWLKMLIETGVLSSGAWETGRGIRCIANDGHECLSLVEKMIDDILFAKGIIHEKEVCYPEERLRCDFYIQGKYIEYFGLAGNSAYDAKTKYKISMCNQKGLSLLALYPSDVVNKEKLETKILDFLHLR